MAADVSGTQLPQELRVPDRRERARRSSYRLRFGILYVVLAAVVGAGVGSFIVLATRPAPAEEEAWSTWRPEGRVNAYPVEIAQHVAPRYRLTSSKQLVGVLAGEARIQDLPIRAVVIQHDASNPTKRDDLEVIEVGNSVMYSLCGAGERCSIAEGTASEDRARLLRREALELALYTFKYADDVDSVIALMPFNLGKPETADDDTSTVVFLQKKDFQRQLEEPLDRTLPGRPRPTLDPIQGQVVDTLTRPRQYLYDIQPTQDLSAILMLAPIPSG
ncbi:MAG: hypothetical protein ACRDNB_00950 [Gaiellaceae bacterium]